MSSAVSVSKGVFVFKSGPKLTSKGSRSKKKAKYSENVHFSQHLWYEAYKSLWGSIEAKIQGLNNGIFSGVLRDLVNFLKVSYENPVCEIPTACLLTGINMPDHKIQFNALKKEIRTHVTPHVACLNGEDCQSLKYLLENAISQFIDENCELENDEERKPRKSRYNFSDLQVWYESLYRETKTSPKKQKTKSSNKSLVVIISDFETFDDQILQHFILILNNYINVLPVVLVFGVSTSLSVLHRKLPFHVSSKVNLQVFNSPQSMVYLNSVLENVFFSKDCPFHLSGNVFNLLTDIFLFYDLSVSGFVQNFKFAMLEHFSCGSAMALCCSTRSGINGVLERFGHEDFENCRRLLSFRKLVESETAENRVKLLTDDDYFSEALKIELLMLQNHLEMLHLFVQCLHVLVADLPKSPLGKQLREIYAFTVSKNITKTAEYKECFHLLSFQSKSELSRKITKIADLLFETVDKCKPKREDLANFHKRLNYFVNNLLATDNESIMDSEDVLTSQISRLQLKEKLKEMSKRPQNGFEKMRGKLLNFLDELFQFYLTEPTSFHFHEIFFFNDVTAIQSHLVGTHRAAIHTALNDPHSYLQCQCCPTANEQAILRSMPDVCIAYKLHLECGKMINLYDWLQAFVTIVDGRDDCVVEPELQARFTQAVAELEYLGFIKSSKKKVDHVARLTWGG